MSSKIPNPNLYTFVSDGLCLFHIDIHTFHKLYTWSSFDNNSVTGVEVTL